MKPLVSSSSVTSCAGHLLGNGPRRLPTGMYVDLHFTFTDWYRTAGSRRAVLHNLRSPAYHSKLAVLEEVDELLEKIVSIFSIY